MATPFSSCLKNSFQRSYKLFFDEENSAKSPEYETPFVQSFLKKPDLSLRALIDLHTYTYDNTGTLTKSRAAMIGSGWHLKIIEFINSGSSDEEKLEFRWAQTLEHYDSVTDEQYESMRQDAAICLPGEKIVANIQFRSNFGFDLQYLPYLRYLSGIMDDDLRHVFSVMMATSNSHGIFSDGIVILMLKILVDEFFENPEKFKDSKILPFEFKVVTIVDPVAYVVNFLLEAREHSRNPKVEQMAEYYKSKNDNKPPKKRRSLPT